MLMKRNAKFIMRNRVERKKRMKGNNNENINQQSMDDFMETPHNKQFVSGELSLTAY